MIMPPLLHFSHDQFWKRVPPNYVSMKLPRPALDFPHPSAHLPLFSFNLHILSNPPSAEFLTQWMPIKPTTQEQGVPSLESSNLYGKFFETHFEETNVSIQIPTEANSFERRRPSLSKPSSTRGNYLTSFGMAAEELSQPAYLDEPDAQECPSPSQLPDSSPAAAFLSSFLTPSFSPPSPDADGLEIAGYILTTTIGRGGFSTVKIAASPSGGTVAVKIVRQSAFDELSAEERMRWRTRFSHEEQIWSSLSHENILPLFHSHHTSEATYLFTLYCPSGSLFDMLKREGTPALEQTDAGCMFRHVVKGLQYMHDTMGLVHGDIKLENILVDESGVCRIADFGLTRRFGGTPCSSDEECSSNDDSCPPQGPSKVIQDRSRGRRSGTSALPVHLSLMRHGQSRHRNSMPIPNANPRTHPDHEFQPGSLPYAAPELLLPRTEVMSGRHSRYLPHSAQDMWALGVLLYALLTGTYPFRDTFEPRLQMKILRGTYESPAAIGPQAESVLRGCLEPNVSKRWNISMVDDAAWGIGYGNVNLDPAISEEQRSQSQSRTRSPPREDLSASIASMSVSSGKSGRSPSSGPWNRLAVRSTSSRSPSSPRTPDDETTPEYFVDRLPQRSSSRNVRVVETDVNESWVHRRDSTSSKKEDTGTLSLSLEDDDNSSNNRTRGRPGTVASKGPLAEARKKSQSRSRSWSLNM